MQSRKQRRLQRFPPISLSQGKRKLEEKLAEQAKELKKVRALLSEAQEVARLGIWEWDVLTDAMDWSPECFSILDLDSPHRLTEDDYRGRIHPDEREEAARFLNHLYANLRSIGSYEFERRLIRPDGDIRSVLGRGKVILNEVGDPVRVVGIVQDVTDRKREEAERARYHQAQIDKLRELDRLKGNFINAASHELRTPLTSIVGFSEFLEDGFAGELNSQQLEFVRQIQSGAQRLQAIVDDLLDFARLESGTFNLKLQSADLKALIQEEVASMSPQAQQKGLSVSLSLPHGPMHVGMDPRRIGQVILNLVGNAIKFTPRGGRVGVNLMPLPGVVRVEVWDTGIGMTPEATGRIFEKFFQVDPSTTREHGGAGLGLALSKALVESHGGQIGVESAYGEGSCFWVMLPR